MRQFDSPITSCVVEAQKIITTPTIRSTTLSTKRKSRKIMIQSSLFHTITAICGGAEPLNIHN